MVNKKMSAISISNAMAYVVRTNEKPPAASLRVSFHHSVSLLPYDCAAPSRTIANNGKNSTSIAPPLTSNLSNLKRADSFERSVSSIQGVADTEIFEIGTEGAGGAIPDTSSARESRSMVSCSLSDIGTLRAR